MDEKNTAKIEALVVVRDYNKRIIAVLNRIEGEQKFEIYFTEIAGIDEVLSLLNIKEAKL